jgi:hypothetical protein
MNNTKIQNASLKGKCQNVLLEELNAHASSSGQSNRENSAKTQHTFKRIFCKNNSSFEIYPVRHGTENLHTAEINTG